MLRDPERDGEQLPDYETAEHVMMGEFHFEIIPDKWMDKSTETCLVQVPFVSPYLAAEEERDPQPGWKKFRYIISTAHGKKKVSLFPF